MKKLEQDENHKFHPPESWVKAAIDPARKRGYHIRFLDWINVWRLAWHGVHRPRIGLYLAYWCAKRHMAWLDRKVKKNKVLSYRWGYSRAYQFIVDDYRRKFKV